jgi:hypothetical protein
MFEVTKLRLKRFFYILFLISLPSLAEAASKGLVARVALVSPALTMANAKPDTSVAIVAAATAHVLIDLWNLKVF